MIAWVPGSFEIPLIAQKMAADQAATTPLSAWGRSYAAARPTSTTSPPTTAAARIRISGALHPSLENGLIQHNTAAACPALDGCICTREPHHLPLTSAAGMRFLQSQYIADAKGAQ